MRKRHCQNERRVVKESGDFQRTSQGGRLKKRECTTCHNIQQSTLLIQKNNYLWFKKLIHTF